MESMKPLTFEAAAEQQARLKKVHAMLTLSTERLIQLEKSFLEELQKGLEMHKKHGITWVPGECSMKMLDSCVANLPTGKEKGSAYALDFGGSTVRAVRCQLCGHGKLQIQQDKVCLKSKEYPCKKGLMDRQARGSDLFNEFALCARGLMMKSGDLATTDASNPVPVGFTFSFPCCQTALGHATLMEWTKGFETGRDSDDKVESRDVAELLNDAFNRIKLPATCGAVVNDTVGTLVSCGYQKEEGAPDCLVGLIVGTGTNCCYVEPEAAKYGYIGKIINLECGNFNKDLPFTDIDIEVDDLSHNTSKQQFEKFISGYYIGDLVRVAVERVFKDRAPSRVHVRHSLPGELASRILDDMSETKEATIAALKTCWQVEVGLKDAQCIHQICKHVFERSAAMAAVSVAALCKKTGMLHKGVTVAIDGALYVKNQWYRERLRHYVDAITGADAANVQLHVADDGSGKGAALIAALS